MKKCFLCRAVLSIGSSGQCDKCKTNEKKYGKPTICKFCQLPAAFKEQKCVHCAYNERKYGAPQKCSRCELTSAFVKDPAKPPKAILCRLCQSVQPHSSSSKSKSSDSSSKRHRHDKISHHNRSSLPIAPSTSSFQSSISTDANVQAYKEKVNELTLMITDKNHQIKDLQQRIVELEADQLRKEKDFRQKLVNLERQNDTTINNLQGQINQLTKELASKQRPRH